MVGPTFVRFTATGPWFRADTISQLSVVQDVTAGVTTWRINGAPGSGGYITMPDEASARQALDDLLETYGALDLSD